MHTLEKKITSLWSAGYKSVQFLFLLKYKNTDSQLIISLIFDNWILPTEELQKIIATAAMVYLAFDDERFFLVTPCLRPLTETSWEKGSLIQIIAKIVEVKERITC